MNLKEQRATALNQAQDIVNAAKAASRELTSDEQVKVKGYMAEIERLDVKFEECRKSEDLVRRLSGAATPHMDSDPNDGHSAKSGSAWAKSVLDNMRTVAAGVGVKALLSGEISTPPAVTVAPLPDIPTRLLDLVPREALGEQTFSYLRQTVRTNNADVVADNALKPTSTYTFEEIEDRARVIAHLSEPFPLRYATDHTSMLQVLDGQMVTGIFEKIEQLIVSGTGLDEEWEGILNTSGVTQVPYSTDVVTTLRKARTTQELKGEAVTGVAMHPTDIEALDLLREDGATGGFLLDSAAWERIFGPGTRGVPSIAVPVGTAIVGNWSQTRLRIREQAQTLAATQAGDLFDKNQMKLRTEGRFGFQLFRPASMAVVDLTAA